MKEYDIKITETLEKTVTVKAESMEAAQAKVEEEYYNSEHILDSENFTGVDFSAEAEREIVQEQKEQLDVLLVKPGMYPQAVQIGSELEDLQKAVGGDTALENDLRSQVDNIESTHPGYDEYRYALDEIGHNPYELAAYLTVVFEDYTREEVQAELVRLFEEQYDLELDEEVEIRSYTTTDEDGNTSTVYYEYRILNVTLTNYGLGNVIASSRLTAEQWERYKVLLETLGNRSYLFGEDVSSAPGGGGEYTDYDIPGEALTDTAFANMVREAEKYLGYPYVWGGSSPSTSFDCSGFVSWVINNCGNGWSVGRQTANGLKNLCDIIPPSEAKPGDLIFFQGTYNTSGASHVGIYVGNGMMIHCGDPISYASIETNYWQQHFYCFGRIP